jgi:hypothetical protein
MAPELQEYYENQFSMMTTKGWKDLVEDFYNLKTSINDITLTTDTHDLFYRKGQLDILDLILKRKDTCEKVYEELSDVENV